MLALWALTVRTPRAVILRVHAAASLRAFAATLQASASIVAAIITKVDTTSSEGVAPVSASLLLIAKRRMHLGLDLTGSDVSVSAVLANRVCQLKGVTGFQSYFLPALRRPSKVMSKAFRAAFQRLLHRCLPRPVGSRLMMTR